MNKREGATKEILQFKKDVLSELTTIGDINKRKNKEAIIQINNYVEKNKPMHGNNEFDNSESVYKVFLKLKHEKNRSWVQLRNGCLDLLGVNVKFTTQPMKNTSRAFAREAQKAAGFSTERILQLLDDRQLGLK